jgi:peroxiredoxin
VTKIFKDKRQAPFVFLADPELHTIHLYGVYNTVHAEHGHIPYPVTFVIDSEGTVVWRYLGLKSRDRPTVEMILKVLDEVEAPLDAF